MFSDRAVLGSLRTFLIDSSVRGLNERSTSFMLTSTLASEGMSLMLLWAILSVFR